MPVVFIRPLKYLVMRTNTFVIRLGDMDLHFDSKNQKKEISFAQLLGITGKNQLIALKDCRVSVCENTLTKPIAFKFSAATLCVHSLTETRKTAQTDLVIPPRTLMNGIRIVDNAHLFNSDMVYASVGAAAFENFCDTTIGFNQTEVTISMNHQDASINRNQRILLELVQHFASTWPEIFKNYALHMVNNGEQLCDLDGDPITEELTVVGNEGIVTENGSVIVSDTVCRITVDFADFRKEGGAYWIPVPAIRRAKEYVNSTEGMVFHAHRELFQFYPLSRPTNDIGLVRGRIVFL